MDAVILAGGKGSRLNGVMPPYMKPFMPINGIPLINRIVDQVQGYVVRTFVIAAPENALHISQVLGDRSVFMVVQREATGPGDALMLGLALTRQDKVLVVMGDNLMPDEDITHVHDAGSTADFVIGTGTVTTADEARHFTRIYSGGVRIEEGPDVSPSNRDDGGFTIWCGPLVLPVHATMAAIRSTRDADAQLAERKIGTHLQAIGKSPRLVECSAVDIGTPDSIMEVN